MGYADTLAQILNASEARHVAAARQRGNVYPKGKSPLLKGGGQPLTTMPVAPPAALTSQLNPGVDPEAGIIPTSTPQQVGPNDAITQAQSLYGQTPYDPSGDMAKYEAAVRLAATRPDQQSLDADMLRGKLQAEQQFGQEADAMPVPQQEEMNASAYPELQLPQVPVRQSPRLDPSSSILAAIGGLISPQYAGQLGAAPLRAGLSNADQQYNDDQQSYSERLKQKILQHQDALQQRDDQIRTSQFNSQVRYKNSEASTRAKMEKSLRTLQMGTDSGRVAALDKYEAAAKPADAGALDAGLLRERMLGNEKADEKRLGRADKLLNLGITQQTRQDNNENTNATRQLAAQLAASSRERAADKSLEARKYASDNSLEGRQYTADKGLEGKKYAADKGLQGRQYTADKRSANLANKVTAGGDAGLPKGVATLLRPYASTMSEAQKSYDKARAAAALRLGKRATGEAIDNDPNVRAAAAGREDATKAWNETAGPFMEKAKSNKVVVPPKSGPKLPTGISGLRVGK